MNLWDRAQFSGVKMPSASFLVDYFFQLKFGLNDVPILCVPPDHQSQINIWRTGKSFIPLRRLSFHLVAEKKEFLFHKNYSILSLSLFYISGMSYPAIQLSEYHVVRSPPSCKMQGIVCKGWTLTHSSSSSSIIVIRINV